jgi:hypothetical protein
MRRQIEWLGQGAAHGAGSQALLYQRDVEEAENRW